ncbi:CHASE2 domain-containing protein [Pseudoxanthomonas daejeonensis]|nr:CHASE2 domain-containing protein [Pseudoxanthomonas daejeonensis]
MNATGTLVGETGRRSGARVAGVGALGAGVLAAALGATGLSAALDDVVHRGLASLHPPLPATSTVVLGIDRANPWPWPNGRLADLLDRLHGNGVRGVALDLPIQAGDSSGSEGDARLARTLFDHRVVLGVALVPQAEGPPRALLPPVEFADAARLGHVLLQPDRDGRLRQHPSQVLATDGIRWTSLPLALVQAGSLDGRGGRKPPERWRIGPVDAAPTTLRAADALAGQIDAKRLQGRWVLVGLVDPALQSPVPGPYGSPSLYPIEYQAQALAALLQGETPRPLPGIAQALLSLLLAGGTVLVGMAGGGRDWRMPIALLGGVAATIALCGWLLTRQWWFAPGGTLAVFTFALLAWTTTVLRQRARARQPIPGLAKRRQLDAALQAARNAARPHALLLVEAGTTPTRDAGEADACRFAQLLGARARRPGDVAAYLGEGRFALLLPGTPATAAESILEDLRQQAASRQPPLSIQGRVHACDASACDCPGWIDPGATVAQPASWSAAQQAAPGAPSHGATHSGPRQ